MFNSVDLLRTNLGGSLSGSSEELLRRGKEEAGIFNSFRKQQQQTQVVGTSKDYCWLKKNTHLKLTNLALFCVWEEARVWTQ